MPYQITTFDGVDLPVYNPVQDHSPAGLETGILDSIGGAYAAFGTAQRYPTRQSISLTGLCWGETLYYVDHTGARILDHLGSAIVLGDQANRLRAQVEAITEKLGVTGQLVRTRLDSSGTQTRTATLLAVQLPQRVEDKTFKAEMTCAFEMPNTTWRNSSATTGQVVFTSSGPYTFSIGHGGNAPALDAVLSILASGSISSLSITNTAAGVDLEWSGTLDSGETLTIDAGAGTVRIGSADEYPNFALGANHSAPGYAPVYPGMSSWTIDANGPGTFSLSFYEQWR